MSGRGTPATVAARRAGIRHTLHEYDHQGTGEAGRRASWGLEAAAALGVAPARVFKTLVLSVDDGGRLVLAVIPVDAELDLKACAAAAGGRRAAMADPTVAERVTGSVVGGISPLGGRRRLAVIVDASAFDGPTMFVSAGRRGLDLELAAGDLVALTGAVVAPIARRA
jgi:Cys-tRNA(Pro)/Cys-tRNA(Cys) deacylase